jgi:hypothetical protein
MNIWLETVRDFFSLPWWFWLGMLAVVVLLGSALAWWTGATIRPVWQRLFGIGAYGRALRRHRRER